MKKLVYKLATVLFSLIILSLMIAGLMAVASLFQYLFKNYSTVAGLALGSSLGAIIGFIVSGLLASGKQSDDIMIEYEIRNLKRKLRRSWDSHKKTIHYLMDEKNKYQSLESERKILEQANEELQGSINKLEKHCYDLVKKNMKLEDIVKSRKVRNMIVELDLTENSAHEKNCVSGLAS